jgi:uncharacterized protein YbjT (DUF2867 family)
MADRKVIVVVGATGAQGGGLARAILADPAGGYAVRAITRDVKSAKAQELARAGAEIVAADIDDEGALTKALRGAHGAYFVTFFWAHFSPDKEKAEAESMARAAKTAGVSHVIWSTLEDTREFIPLSDSRMPTLQGKYKVPHFDAKGESDRFFAEQGLPTTRIRASFYNENFISFGQGPRRMPDGKLALTLPMGKEKMGLIASEDIGRCAYAIFKRGASAVGKTFGLAGDHLTGDQMAAEFTRALGQEVRYSPFTPAAFRALGFPGADDLGNMFQFYTEFADYLEGARSLSETRALNPQTQTFSAWLRQNARRIPLE